MAALLGTAVADAASPAAGALDIVEPLSLHYGVNVVPAFLPDGGPATIVLAHRENGNAHGYDVYVVYASADRAGGPQAPALHGVAELIDVEPASGALQDVIRDDPFDGEAVVGALRFVRVRVDGHPSIALVQARRQVGATGSLTDAAPVELTISRLDGPADLVGRTRYVFHETSRTVTARRYCNAIVALNTELGIAYPDGWDAAPSVDGCASAADVQRNASALQMLRTLDVRSFPNSTSLRRRSDAPTLADYGLTRIETFDDGWAYASQPDRSWTFGVLVLEDGSQRKLLCVTDSANGSGTYRATSVVEAVPAGDGLWKATGRVVKRADCTAR